MGMKQVDTITIAALTEMAEKMYGNLVKGVVDRSVEDPEIQQKIIRLVLEKVKP
jgi:hypothetical protein